MSLQVETQEAICSALYMNPFAEFLGERDIEGEHIAYFHIGEKPKDLRVSVIRPDHLEEVRVKIEWRNHWADARNPLKGEKVLTIRTYGADQNQLLTATADAVVKVLEVYRDVVAEEGVAGQIEMLAPETSEDDE